MTRYVPPLPCGAALSQHPVAAQATGEAVADILETVGAGPDVAVLAVTGTHRSSVDAVVDTVSRLLQPGSLLWCATEEVTVGESGLVDTGAVAIWAASPGRVEPWSGGLPEAAEGTMLVLASEGADLDMPLGALGAQRNGMGVVGGVLPPGSRVGLTSPTGGSATSTVPHGAFGVVMPPQRCAPLAVPGFRPVGDRLAVTASDGEQLAGLASRPALHAVNELIGSLDDAERAVVADGLWLGVVVDEHDGAPCVEDLVIDVVRGVVPDRDLVVTTRPAPLGAVVQFALPDSGHARTAAVAASTRFCDAGQRVALLAVTTGSGGASGQRDAGGGKPEMTPGIDVMTIGGVAVISPVGQRSWVQAHGTSGAAAACGR